MKTIAVNLYYLLFIVSLIQAQQADTSSVYSSIESYLEEATMENSNEQIIDLVEQLLENPIDINKASIEDLSAIPFIDIAAASKIIDYRLNSGRIFSLQEINMIPEIPAESVNILKEFIYVDDVNKMPDTTPESRGKSSGYRDLKLSIRTRIIKDLQMRKGFADRRFSGNNLKTYTRLKSSYNNVRIGFLAEKDAGELSFSDFLSFHLEIKEFGILNRLVLGDYLFEFGQGLAVWGPYSFSKGADATGPINRKNRNIVSYTSSDENNFFRGIASKLELGNLSISAFYSSKTLDASLIEGAGEIKSLVNTGLHRTDTELLTKSSVHEKVYGASLNVEISDAVSVALLYISDNFSLPLHASGFRDLSGSTFNSYSVSINTRLGNLFLSGETAYDGKSFAWIYNLQYSLSRRISLLASARSYDRSYNSLYSNGLGESTNTQNELGFYLGVRWNSPFGLLNFYFDQFKFPSATFNNPLPGIGSEILINYSEDLSSSIKLVLRYKIENKEVTDDLEGAVIQANRQRQNARMEFKFDAGKKIKLRNRFEYTLINSQSLGYQESGFLTYLDVKYKPSSDFSFYTRIIFFETDSYNSRIYEFENDLRGVMTNTPLYGKGMKWYLMLRYTLTNLLTLSIKYSELFKPEENFLGSGLSEIQGSIDNRLSIQIELLY